MQIERTTALLEWRPEYTIGESGGDMQHRDVFRRIDALHDSEVEVVQVVWQRRAKGNLLSMRQIA
ncbi:MAG: hypothetical protein IT178_14675 [Acidobacteria bacterium]|nr:hypothetical protein [Acidobacteriota bacterium]